MPPKQPSLPHRIATDPAYHDVIKLVGYRGIPTPISETDYKRLLEKHGRERLGSVSEAVVDINAETKLATLKAEVRSCCTAILGPAPENWDQFYEGIENPPPNPYLTPPPNGTAPKPRRKRRPKPEPTIDQVAEAVADAIQEETGMDVEIRNPDVPAVNQLGNKKTLVDNSEPHNPLEAFQLDVLTDRLTTARMRCLCAKTPKAQNRAYRDVQRLLAEYERRNVAVPLPSPDVRARTTVVAPSGLTDITTVTDRRLRELLDMNFRELETCGLDSVCYEEAVRDVRLIEAEVRRRQKAAYLT